MHTHFRCFLKPDCWSQKGKGQLTITARCFWQGFVLFCCKREKLFPSLKSTGWRIHMLIFRLWAMCSHCVFPSGLGTEWQQGSVTIHSKLPLHKGLKWWFIWFFTFLLYDIYHFLLSAFHLIFCSHPHLLFYGGQLCSFLPPAHGGMTEWWHRQKWPACCPGTERERDSKWYCVRNWISRQRRR